jgi:hypothetical protein
MSELVIAYGPLPDLPPVVELRGGPHDGEMHKLPDGFSAWDDDAELYLPVSGTKPPMLATYRHLFGAFDHLDYAGWHFIPEAI